MGIQVVLECRGNNSILKYKGHDGNQAENPRKRKSPRRLPWQFNLEELFGAGDQATRKITQGLSGLKDLACDTENINKGGAVFSLPVLFIRNSS